MKGLKARDKTTEPVGEHTHVFKVFEHSFKASVGKKAKDKRNKADTKNH